MKPFNPSWTQVALIAVLLTAVILSHAYAPAAAAATVSIVSTIVGFVFGNAKKLVGEEEEK